MPREPKFQHHGSHLSLELGWTWPGFPPIIINNSRSRAINLYTRCKNAMQVDTSGTGTGYLVFHRHCTVRWDNTRDDGTRALVHWCSMISFALMAPSRFTLSPIVLITSITRQPEPWSINSPFWVQTKASRTLVLGLESDCLHIATRDYGWPVTMWIRYVSLVNFAPSVSTVQVQCTLITSNASGYMIRQGSIPADRLCIGQCTEITATSISYWYKTYCHNWKNQVVSQLDRL